MKRPRDARSFVTMPESVNQLFLLDDVVECAIVGLPDAACNAQVGSGPGMYRFRVSDMPHVVQSGDDEMVTRFGCSVCGARSWDIHVGTSLGCVGWQPQVDLPNTVMGRPSSW